MTDSGTVSDGSVTPEDVVEMHDNGTGWSEIAEKLGTDIDTAMQVYRDEKYNYWDTGWQMDADGGTGLLKTGPVVVWTESDATVEIDELHGEIPLRIAVEDDKSQNQVLGNLSPEQARTLAETLNECADIVERNR